MKVELEITPSQISDQFCAAIEGGYSPWLGAVWLDESAADQKEKPWYSNATVFAVPFKIRVEHDNPETDDDGDHSASTIITEKEVNRGLIAMAKGNPRQFGLLLGDDGDALTADIFLQHVLFGKAIYG